MTNPNPKPVDPLTDPDTAACFGEAWSWNPVDWVLVPTKCALLWAFKPPEGYMDAKITGLKTAWSDTSPVQWLGVFTGLDVGAGASGCQGVPLDVNLGGGVRIDEHLGAACSGQMADVAALVRLVTSAGVIIYGGWACVRVLLGGLGVRPEFNPDGSVMERAT